MKLSLSLTALLAFVLLLVAACSTPPAVQRLDGVAEGTTYSVQWWQAEPKPERAAVAQAINAELARIDKSISGYRPDSDIEHFNAFKDTQPHPVSAEILDLLRIAAHVHQATSGCYDPTIKPLFDLWGFAGDRVHIPTAQELATAEAETGMDKLIISDGQLTKQVPGLAVDLSSFGEGYSIGRLAAVLEQFGIHNYLVEMGGDLVARGSKPDNVPWRIAVERPAPGERRVQRIFTLPTDRVTSVNTSGTYRHYFDAEGHRYSHIIDPRTGQPVTHNLVEVSVFDNNSTLGDAWATALLCLGPEQGMKVAQEQGLRARFVTQDPTGKLHEWQSPALTADRALRIESPATR